jgi:predicted RNA-binding protein with PUA-like domain
MYDALKQPNSNALNPRMCGAATICIHKYADSLAETPRSNLGKPTGCVS